MRRRPEVAVVGAGIVGAACAAELAARGAPVTVFSGGELGSGATAEGMGHLLYLEDHPEQFELIHRSMTLWHELYAALPAGCEVDPCGTIWLAADEEDLRIARQKAEKLTAGGVHAEVVDQKQVHQMEPLLRPEVLGGLFVPADGVLYPPRVVHYLLLESPSARRIRVRLHEPVVAVEGAGDRAGAVDRARTVDRMSTDVTEARSSAGRARPRLQLQDGSWHEFDHIVVAAGVGTGALLPETGIQPRKGHLAITDRCPGFVHHHVVELAYVRNTHMGQGDSISSSVQPRRTGQVLIGSSRQLAGFDRDVDRALLARMLQKAAWYFPSLADLPILRVWTGLRPASPDDRPWIGAMPNRRGVWVASGHEGLGITTGLGTGELIADLVLGRTPRVSPDVYAPASRREALRPHAVEV